MSSLQTTNGRTDPRVPSTMLWFNAACYKRFSSCTVFQSAFFPTRGHGADEISI